jgi:hypothetical protein
MNGLLADISEAAMQSMSSGVAWHGGLMVLAWVVLMPAGFLVARFYKITPGQDWPRRLNNPFWFRNHRRLGYAIGIVTAVAVACVVWTDGTLILWRSSHALTGWVLLALAAFQIVGSLLRGIHGGPVDRLTRKPVPPEQWPGDHFSMTRRRIVFEYSHKTVGYFLVLVTIWQIAGGLRDADAPRWIWVVLGLWTLIFVAAFTRLQRAGKCIDTYQAIWGLDESLPGYRRKPIGWGITRVRGP